MSITLRPRLMAIVPVEEDCLCTSYMVSGADPACNDCKGTGLIMKDQYEHYLQINTVRFNIIWSALGLDAMDGFGEIDPQVLMTAIKNYIPGLAETSEGWYGEGDTPALCTVAVNENYPGPKVLMGAMTAPMVTSRLNAITKLVNIAIRTNDVIVWD